ncbi:phosphopantetheine-binding protein [Streptomyces jumonjinensis]|uniref:phosphopantetheine-binding protein n=1 Tax=Streptomyces jumonjinensis TaxID=1945 RepID=UPI0037BD9FCF
MTRDRSAVIGPLGRAQDVRESLFAAWSELLGCANLTEHSDFFARGGDSLLMTRLVRRISKEFGVVVSLREMSWRNLGDQIALVDSRRSQPATPPQPRPVVTAGDIRAFLRRQWAELLDCPSPGDDADLFVLGGDSLTVTRLARRLGKEFGVAVAVPDILAATTLGGQTLLVNGLLTGGLNSPAAVGRRVA